MNIRDSVQFYLRIIRKKGMKSDQLEYGFSVEYMYQYMYQFKYGMMRNVSMRVFVGVISVFIVSQPNA